MISFSQLIGEKVGPYRVSIIGGDQIDVANVTWYVSPSGPTVTPETPTDDYADAFFQSNNIGTFNLFCKFQTVNGQTRISKVEVVVRSS